MPLRKARIDPFGFKPKPIGGGIKSVYDSASTQQASDYDDIMGNYRSIYDNARTGGGGNTQGMNYSPLSANLTSFMPMANYERGADLQKQIGQLQGTSETGGYSDSDISNIRERGISPIRSIYDSAKRDMSRQKSLSGGYSPNAGALSAKLAREGSARIGDITTKVNADIAQMVASGKLSASQLLAPLLAKEDEIRNATTSRNEATRLDVENRNNEERSRVDQINREMQMALDKFRAEQGNENTNTQLNATQGMQSLYGTTPALTKTFGDQVLANNAQNMQANQTANMLKNQRANIGLNLVNSQLGQSNRLQRSR